MTANVIYELTDTDEELCTLVRHELVALDEDVTELRSAVRRLAFLLGDDTFDQGVDDIG